MLTRFLLLPCRAHAGWLCAHRWRLDTRYYTADVEVSARAYRCLHCCICVRLSGFSLLSRTLRRWNSETAARLLGRWRRWFCRTTRLRRARSRTALCACVSLTLPCACCSRQQESSFAEVTAWYDAAAQQWDCEPEVRLCVAIRGVACREVGEDTQASCAAAWCVSNGFEHVPLAQPHDEPQGLARVKEALQAHDWPGLQPKPRPQRNNASDAPHAPAPRHGAGEVHGEAQMQEEDEFDALMGQMLAARDAASAGALPDSQRRAAAAELALRMAALLGGDSESEGSETEEEG